MSPYTREVLKALEDRGVPVVFVTGRPLRWAAEVFEHVGSHGLAVVSNGALVWDVARSRVHLERPIPAATAREACRLLREAVPGTAYAVETLDGFGLEPGYRERHPVPDDSRRAPSTSCSNGRRSSCWPGTRSSSRRPTGMRPRR